MVWIVSNCSSQSTTKSSMYTTTECCWVMFYRLGVLNEFSTVFSTYNGFTGAKPHCKSRSILQSYRIGFPRSNSRGSNGDQIYIITLSSTSATTIWIENVTQRSKQRIPINILGILILRPISWYDTCSPHLYFT